MSETSEDRLLKLLLQEFEKHRIEIGQDDSWKELHFALYRDRAKFHRIEFMKRSVQEIGKVG